MAWLFNAAFRVFTTIFFYDAVTALIINFLIPEQILIDTDEAQQTVAALANQLFMKHPSDKVDQSSDDADSEDDDDDDDVDADVVNMRDGRQKSSRRKQIDIPFSSSDYFFRSTVICFMIYC